MFEKDLRIALVGDTALAALVTGPKNTVRIWWKRRRQPVVPAIVLTKIPSGPRHYTYEARDDLVGYLIQFDVWAAEAEEAVDIKNALIARLDALTVAPFQGAFLQNERDGFEPGAGPSGADLHRESFDARIFHKPQGD